MLKSTTYKLHLFVGFIVGIILALLLGNMGGGHMGLIGFLFSMGAAFF